MATVQLGASISLLFQEHRPLDRLAALREAGLFGAEIQTLESDPIELAGAARRAGVEVVLLNVGPSDFAAGGLGLSGVPSREREFRRALAETLAAADILGASLVHLGPSRVPAGVPRRECLAVYRDNIAAAIELSSRRETILTIEPINTHDQPDVLLFDCDEAATLIQQVGSPRLGLQLDIYHATRSGRDAATLLLGLAPVIRHLQFADAPGRHEPGTGSIDFPRILDAIAESGYRGWLDAEYYPSQPTGETLGWVAAFRQGLPR
jgi:hydroxypyruvate isomerase